MDNDFSTRVKGKSKDDLVRIILNTEEYNSEFVAAAEKELRIRMDEGTRMTSTEPNPIRSVPSVPVSPNRETPFGVYFAGILFILSAIFWISIASFQVDVGSFTDEDTLQGIGLWNTFMAVAQIAIAIGIFTLKRWGLSWGLGTSLINCLFLGYYYSSNNLFVFLIMSLIGGVTFVSLVVCKNSFQRIPAYRKPLPHSSSVPASESLLYLHDLIRSKRSGTIGSNHLDEVTSYLAELCPTKEEAKKLLEDYQVHFDKSLVQGLSGLSNSYAKIANLCEPFIRFELVKPTYPHDKI